jgi:hypothetical protein
LPYKDKERQTSFELWGFSFNTLVMTNKTCRLCNKEKNTIEFRTKQSRGRVYTPNTCRDCENEQQRIRNATPERKAYIKEKHQSVKYKSKQLEYQKTDNYKERVFKYRRTTEYKKKEKEKNKTENRIEYQKEYSKRDYVKERVKKHYDSQEYKEIRMKYLETDAGKLSRKKANENWLNSDKRMLELLNKQFGIDKKLITPELIELKRITLKTTRLCQQLKN